MKQARSELHLLAFDIGGVPGFAALTGQMRGGDLRLSMAASRRLNAPRDLSRCIISTMDETLREAGWGLDEVDALCVGLGPGSWTGLRIGLTTAKTLAQTRGWKLCGVPTMDAIGASALDNLQDEDGARSCLMLTIAPCRPGEVYGALYQGHEAGLELVQPVRIGTPQSMADALGAESLARDIEAPFIVAHPEGAGAAAQSVASILEAQGDVVQCVEVGAEALAFEIGRAGVVALLSGEDSDPLELTPLYLAPSAAERNLLAPSNANPGRDAA